MQLINTLEVSNELGEGIIWDHHRQRAWWVDILQHKLYRYDPVSESLEQWDTPERLCCFAPMAGQEELACAFESGFAFFWPETGEVQWIEKIEQDNPGTRFNDGRTDRQGRLWAGTMVEDAEKATYKGSLYCLHNDLSITKSIGGLAITNSLCWSPDGNTVYHTDTPTGIIHTYPFDTANATLGEPTELVKTQQGCNPDGSIVDADGYLWNAQWGGSKVVRYSPTGKVDLELNTPTSQPSCVTFGGANLDLLFVTSAHADMDVREPQAGHMFVYQTNFKGIEEQPFRTNVVG